jgi:hypothetical protein
MESIETLRQIARPMVFQTGVRQAPFSLAGTWFMAGYRRTVFAVTARHVVRDHPANQLLLFPTDASTEVLRVSEWWNVADEENDQDRSDVFVASIDFAHLSKRTQGRSRLVHLDPDASTQWFEDRHTSMLFLCGYPSSINEADYEHSRAMTRQVLLAGSYTGPSITDGVHSLRLDNPLGLDFNGLSGAAVYSLRHELHGDSKPRFCGMAIRGGASAGVLHFLEASVILQVLGLAAARSQSRRPPFRRKASAAL